MATRKTTLRVVTPGTTPPPATARPRKKNVAQAAATGSHRDLLVALRDRIARTVESPNCPPRDLAALSRRLQDIAKEIEQIDLRAKQEAREDGVTPDEECDPDEWTQAR